ncbi:PREDICTED: uncharacterized protein LOC105365394 [Ceratosolen solmsi marchali]|uniref:Uncharacterized protein LOC105365394 n=1 Tax=Ceratosolen solmsi marchali TaxID=326594 RepID=A0AAJ7DZ82_9HYME|nr:PREDICTED: uncharacterized protein LOC105365394 [Ceratosolen solmsi marchali]
MQIASTCKGCSCDKCETLKDKNPTDAKLNNEKCQNGQFNRHRALARSRPTKMKIRYTYGNHHRLDHTYAAVANVNDVLYLKPIKNSNLEPTNQWFKKHNSLFNAEEKQILTVETNHHLKSNFNESKECQVDESGDELFFGSIKNETDEINLKSTWLRNLCLEYQPSKNFPNSQVQEIIHLDETMREKHTQFHFSRINGTLKQYQKNKKVNKSKTEVSSFVGNGKVTKSVQEDKKRWIAALALIELAQSK